MDSDRRMVWLLFLVSWIACSPLFAFVSSCSPDDHLGAVNKIYLQKDEFGVGQNQASAQQARLISFLTQELLHKGYAIVDNIVDADAILRGTFGDVVVVDGEQPDPPKYFYQYQLVSKSKAKLWGPK